MSWINTEKKIYREPSVTIARCKNVKICLLHAEMLLAKEIYCTAQGYTQTGIRFVYLDCVHWGTMNSWYRPRFTDHNIINFLLNLYWPLTYNMNLYKIYDMECIAIILGKNYTWNWCNFFINSKDISFLLNTFGTLY